MKKQFAAGTLAVALAVGGLLFASPAMAEEGPADTPTITTMGGDHAEKKVWVCKYVGTPGVDERLQTGGNPINVSVNTLKDFPADQDNPFPWQFADEHGKSVAIGYSTKGEEEPSLDNCPPPTPNNPIKVTPPAPTFDDPCGVNNGTVYTTETEGVIWSENQVGPTTKVAATAAEGYVLEGTTSWSFKDSGVLCPTTNVVCEALGEGPVGTNLNGLWGNVDTRSAGHYEYVDGGLKVWTDDASSNAKVSLGTSADFLLSQTGEIGLDWEGTTPAPGVNLFVDFDSDGDIDGTLVYESVYGQDLWLTNGSAQFVKDAAPSHVGGNGSENHGTINEWLTVFPEATVKGIAFSLGSGVLGDGVIKSITVGCQVYTFDFEEEVVIPEPTPVTLADPEWVDVCGTEDDDVDFPADVEGVHYAWKTEDPSSEHYWTLRAWIEEGYAVEGPLGNWKAAGEGIYELTFPMTDKACEVTPTPKPEPEPTTPTGKGDVKTPTKTVASGTLATTGSDMNLFLPIAGGSAVMLGLALTLLRRFARNN